MFNVRTQTRYVRKTFYRSLRCKKFLRINITYLPYSDQLIVNTYKNREILDNVKHAHWELPQTLKSESTPKTHMRNEMSAGNVTQLKHSFSTHNKTVPEMPQVQYHVDFLNQTVQTVSASFLHKKTPVKNFLINLTSTSTRDINVIPDKDFKWWAKPENIISFPTFPSTVKLENSSQDYGPWKFKFVTVEVLNTREITRDKGNDINVVYDESEELYKLRLTPTVVVKWVYKLARALAEGILGLVYM